MALEDENTPLRRENRNLLQCFSAVETTPQLKLRFQVPTTHMQPLVTHKLGNSSIQSSSGSPVVHSISPPVTSQSPLITSSMVDTALLRVMSVELNALNAAPHQSLQTAILPTLGSALGNDLRAPVYTIIPVMTSPICEPSPPISIVN